MVIQPDEDDKNQAPDEDDKKQAPQPSKWHQSKETYADSRNEVGRLQTKFSTYLEKTIGVSVCKLCSCHEQSHNLY